jgi:protein involved in polysaccharide export with SLBB domain
MSNVGQIRAATWLRTILVVVVAMLYCPAMRGQDDSADSAVPGSFSSDTGSTSTKRTVRSSAAGDESESVPGMEADGLPADRLIEILNQKPEVLDEIKATLAQRLQDQGRPISEAEITDDMLFNRIEQDASFRVLLTEQLREKGYLTQSDLDALGLWKSERAGTPHQRRKPAAKATRQTEPAADQNQPQATERPNPYPGLPALQDLYRQIQNQKATLQRFGADIFQNGTGNLESLPMDLPAGPDYVLGPGDGLNINTWGSVSQRFTRTVDRGGKVSLPEAGDVVVAGQSVADAQKTIEQALRVQFRDINVDVSLTRLRTIRVYVVGDVMRPGAYDISSLSTPLNALYAAGGPTPRGSLRTVRHYRGDRLIREVDLYELLLRGVHSDTARLEPGDTILVPPVGPQVAVAGMVRRPAIYELKGSTELSDVLELAGGVLVAATLRQINVERIEAHERRVMLSVQLPASGDKQAVQQALGSFKVQDGDRVTISPILPYSDETVYVEGHVFRPGKYPYHKGIEIKDVIRSYQDLLPEPADHGEIIRLEPPDYRPATIVFSLGEVLGGEDPIELRPFDTIRIFGRYEIDPPKVSIYGEVLRPGRYPLARNMTTSDLVRMAGGFKRSAYTASADVTSYVVQNGARVRTKYETIAIGKALAGDSSADLVLKPGDVVTIHQLSGWKEIGASVTVKGEVQYPGTYGIEEGEKLSSLLLRTHGFRADAYPEGAVLERLQVKELEERNRKELIQRIETAAMTPKLGAGAEQAAMGQAMFLQRQQIVKNLKNQPTSGRLVIRIFSNIRQWQNTPADIELRSGDVLTIPRRPNFVMVSGQVYNASAITYTPGKNAHWYLHQAGGPTDSANRKDIYIIRANGSVIGREGSGSGWWKGNVLSTAVHPGDTIVVPEKIVGGGTFWKTALSSAQVISSLSIAAAAVHSF